MRCGISCNSCPNYSVCHGRISDIVEDWLDESQVFSQKEWARKERFYRLLQEALDRANKRKMSISQKKTSKICV